MELIHYGASEYDPELFTPISDIHYYKKPNGGLWTSPVGSEYGWKEWADDNKWGDTDSNFTIKFKGNVFKIDSYEDMLLLPWVDNHGVLFEALIACGYDAVHLTVKGEKETRYSDPKGLYGWDCESVLILNKECITDKLANDKEGAV